MQCRTVQTVHRIRYKTMLPGPRWMSSHEHESLLRIKNLTQRITGIQPTEMRPPYRQRCSCTGRHRLRQQRWGSSRDPRGRRLPERRHRAGRAAGSPQDYWPVRGGCNTMSDSSICIAARRGRWGRGHCDCRGCGCSRGADIPALGVLRVGGGGRKNNKGEERVEERNGAGEHLEWCCWARIGWCGRLREKLLDLAFRLASQ